MPWTSWRTLQPCCSTIRRVRHSGPASPGIVSLIPEQQFHRPLFCGLQIQNFDDDDREGEFARGLMNMGTLGCFVELASGHVALLSNNHVVAAENRGRVGHDRILQPGTSLFDLAMHVATLSGFEPMVPSPHGAHLQHGNVVYNEIDAGAAALLQGQTNVQGYLPGRIATGLNGTATAALDDRVFKVGRTTSWCWACYTRATGSEITRARSTWF